jgi:hypothetical protein
LEQQDERLAGRDREALHQGDRLAAHIGQLCTCLVGQHGKSHGGRRHYLPARYFPILILVQQIAVGYGFGRGLERDCVGDSVLLRRNNKAYFSLGCAGWGLPTRPVQP